MSTETTHTITLRGTEIDAEPEAIVAFLRALGKGMYLANGYLCEYLDEDDHIRLPSPTDDKLVLAAYCSYDHDFVEYEAPLDHLIGSEAQVRAKLILAEQRQALSNAEAAVALKESQVKQAEDRLKAAAARARTDLDRYESELADALADLAALQAEVA